MDCSMPIFPVPDQLLEIAQTPVHQVDPSIDTIQPSHLLLSPSPPAFNLSQNQGLFQPMNHFFASGSQSTGVSASASVLPVNIQDWFPLGLTGWIPLQSKGFSRVFSNTTVQKHQFFVTLFFMVQLSHPYRTTRKITALTIWIFVGKLMSLLFNMLSRFIIASLPRSKHLLI